MSSGSSDNWPGSSAASALAKAIVNRILAGDYDSGDVSNNPANTSCSEDFVSSRPNLLPEGYVQNSTNGGLWPERSMGNQGIPEKTLSEPRATDHEKLKENELKYLRTILEDTEIQPSKLGRYVDMSPEVSLEEELVQLSSQFSGYNVHVSNDQANTTENQRKVLDNAKEPSPESKDASPNVPTDWDVRNSANGSLGPRETKENQQSVDGTQPILGSIDLKETELKYLRSLLERTEAEAARAEQFSEMKSSSEVALQDELAKSKCEAEIWRLEAQASQGECSLARVGEASFHRRLEHLEFSRSFQGQQADGSSQMAQQVAQLREELWQDATQREQVVGELAQLRQQLSQSNDSSGAIVSTMETELQYFTQRVQVVEEFAQLREQLRARDMELDAAKSANVLARAETEAREVCLKQQSQMAISEYATLMEAERALYERRIAELTKTSERAHEEIRCQTVDCKEAFNDIHTGLATMLIEAQTLSAEQRLVLQKLVGLSRRKLVAYGGQPASITVETTNVPTAAVTVASSPLLTPGITRVTSLTVDRPQRALTPPPQMPRSVSPMLVQRVPATQACPMPLPSKRLEAQSLAGLSGTKTFIF